MDSFHNVACTPLPNEVSSAARTWRQTNAHAYQNNTPNRRAARRMHSKHRLRPDHNMDQPQRRPLARPGELVEWGADRTHRDKPDFDIWQPATRWATRTQQVSPVGIGRMCHAVGRSEPANHPGTADWCRRPFGGNAYRRPRSRSSLRGMGPQHRRRDLPSGCRRIDNRCRGSQLRWFDCGRGGSRSCHDSERRRPLSQTL